MKITDNCIKIVTYYEGLYLNAYYDETGKVWTIGYGHTKNVYEGMVITEEQAIQFLKEDMEESEYYVNEYVKYTIEQWQFDSLVSFVFNVGCGTFYNSTMLSYINSGLINEGGDEFLKYIYSGNVILEGLKKRRNTEREYFLYRDLSSIGGEKPIDPPIPTLDYYRCKTNYIFGFTDKLYGRKFTSKDNKFNLIKKIGDMAIIKDSTNKQIKVPFKNLKKL